MELGLMISNYVPVFPSERHAYNYTRGPPTHFYLSIHPKYYTESAHGAILSLAAIPTRPIGV